MTGTAAVIEFWLDTPAYLTDDAHGGLVAGDQVIRDVIDEAVLAEQVGFDSFNIAEHYRSVVATHLKGNFAMMQTAARAMAKQGAGGSLVAMGSGFLSPTPHLATYRAAKAGVLAFTKTAALDLADTGIRANCVSPAANTRMTESHGIRIRGDADDVAPLIAVRAYAR